MTQTRRSTRRSRPRVLRVVALAVLGGFGLVLLQHSPVGEWSIGDRSFRSLTIGDLFGDGGAEAASYTAEWRTLTGDSYRMTVTPSSDHVDEGSPEECIAPPDEGKANLGFDVVIENLTDHAAPMPEVLFAVNASADGQLDVSQEALAGTNRTIEVTPRAEGVGCDDAAAIRPPGRPEIPEGERVTLHGLVGGIVTPVPDGLSLLIRYIQADDLNPDVAGTASLRAPFPKDER